MINRDYDSLDHGFGMGFDSLVLLEVSLDLVELDEYIVTGVIIR